MATSTMSQAGAFARDMRETEKGAQVRKVRTLSEHAFQQINPEEPVMVHMREGLDYRNATVGEAELSRIEQAHPQSHASSFVTHAATLGNNRGDVAGMQQ